MIDQIWRRLQLLIAQGVGLRVSTHSIQIQILDGEILDNVDRIQPYGFSYKPKKGCQAYSAFPNGDRSHGLCIIVGDRRYTLDLEDGETALHDDHGQKVHLTRTGIVIDGAGKPVTITNTPKTRIESDLEVTGDITDRVDDGGRSMRGMREVFGIHDHQGDSGGTTSTPNQEM